MKKSFYKIAKWFSLVAMFVCITGIATETDTADIFVFLFTIAALALLYKASVEAEIFYKTEDK